MHCHFKSDEAKNYLEPTVISGVAMDDVLLEDEIFDRDEKQAARQLPWEKVCK